MINKFVGLLVVGLVITSLFSGAPVVVAASVTPANGGQNLPTGSGFVNLTNVFISEVVGGEISVGTHIINLPAGWEFDTSGTVEIVTTSSLMVISPTSLNPGASSFSFQIQSPSVPASDLAIKSMRVRPTGTAGGNITHSGAAITGIVNGATSLGALSVAGGGGGGSSSVGPLLAAGGGGAGAPIVPPSGISVRINNGAETTNSRTVTLYIVATYAGDMIIANDEPIFENSVLESFAERKTWTLSAGAGEKRVHIKFRSPTGVYSEAVSDSIRYEPAAVAAPMPEPGSPDVNIDGTIDIGDAATVITGWNNAGATDINRDGVTDIKDFNAVMAGWDGAVPSTRSGAADTIFRLSPIITEARTGGQVAVTIEVLPGSNPIYTTRLVLNYSANMLEVAQVSYENGWMPLSIGINASDAAGTLVRTAGFPRGLDSNRNFMRVVFNAKRPGTATVSVNSGSVAMDGRGLNEFGGGLAQTAITITGTPVAAATIVTPAARVTSVAPTAGTEAEAPVTETTEQPVQPLGALVVDLFSNLSPAAYAAAIAILAAAGYGARRWFMPF